MSPLFWQCGTQSRMRTEYLYHFQDDTGVATTCRDKLADKEVTIRSKYLVGADGGNSLVAAHAGLPFEGKMGVGGSMNILFRADLSKYVAHRPSVLYWIMQPGADGCLMWRARNTPRSTFAATGALRCAPALAVRLGLRLRPPAVPNRVCKSTPA